ncbi:XRE family transcriptional regulator [Terracoccus luteus]|uniref:XRE family transcriptional regulator n=2 Tax=Terracoccus luteus TaxID=53356 RepID=A0A495XWA5_9MICO|nr:XRE family transcriptional regulator [Terracoccus luteus]
MAQDMAVPAVDEADGRSDGSSGSASDDVAEHPADRPADRPADEASLEALASLEAFDAEQLGLRLRSLREAKGQSLRSVARRLDISASALSQIERGVLRPSVNRLFAIVTVLGVSLVDLFREGEFTDTHPAPPPNSYSLRRALEVETLTLDGGVRFRRLSPGMARGVDFFESTYPPGSTGSSQNELITHSGFEIGTVTQGELVVDFADERVVLRAGDSISYACETPHRLSNQSDAVTVATWVIVHPEPARRGRRRD